MKEVSYNDEISLFERLKKYKEAACKNQAKGE